MSIYALMLGEEIHTPQAQLPSASNDHPIDESTRSETFSHCIKRTKESDNLNTLVLRQLPKCAILYNLHRNLPGPRAICAKVLLICDVETGRLNHVTVVGHGFELYEHPSLDRLDIRFVLGG